MPNWRQITLKKVVSKICTVTYELVRDPVMIRDGLHPKGTLVVSTSQHQWNRKQLPSLIQLPNLSAHYHAVTRGFWEFYGLGDKCLLASENNDVKAVMSGLYPETSFTTTDYFTELQSGYTDVVWDVCLPAPAQLIPGSFSSVIASALVEHLIDPTAAFANLLALVRPAGHLYAHTHTPSYPLHRYPRDYVRFHHDYFEDLPKFLADKYQLNVRLRELWSHRGHVILCYERQCPVTEN